MAMKKPSAKRSNAAKKGWETRRAKAAASLKVKRSQAAKKGWETRRARAASVGLPVHFYRAKHVLPSVSERERALEIEVARLKAENALIKKNAQKKIERLKERVEVLKNPPKKQIQQYVKEHPDESRMAVVRMIQQKMSEGRGFYESMYDTWADVNFLDEFEEIDDIREIWGEEGTTP